MEEFCYWCGEKLNDRDRSKTKSKEKLCGICTEAANRGGLGCLSRRRRMTTMVKDVAVKTVLIMLVCLTGCGKRQPEMLRLLEKGAAEEKAK